MLTGCPWPEWAVQSGALELGARFRQGPVRSRFFCSNSSRSISPWA